MSLSALLRATAIVAGGAVIGGAGWFFLQEKERGGERIVLASVVAPQREAAPQEAPSKTAMDAARRKLDEALRNTVTAPPASTPPQPAQAAAPTQNALPAKAAEALKAALAQGGVSTVAKSPPPTALQEEREAMLAKAGRYLAAGDVAGARLLLKRAAREGDGQALFLLGEAHDPQALAARGLPQRLGDAAQARAFYQQALAQGYAPARPKLAGLR